MFEVRTDLAVEENERITKAQEETKGISSRKKIMGKNRSTLRRCGSLQRMVQNRWENRKELILHWKQLR